MIDIAIYAVIAIVIGARLWAVLGQRNDDEPQRPNPFVGKPSEPPATRAPSADDENVMVLPDRGKIQQIPGLLPAGAFAPVTPPGSLAAALDQVKEIDASFDEKAFLQGAKAAFAMVVEDYAKGELSRIEKLLAAPVLYSFRQAVEARRESGVTMEARVKEIIGAEVSAARVEGKRLFLTTDFASRQINVTRNADASIVSGSPDKVEEMRDVWVFSRDTLSADPNWQIVETKS